MLAVFRYNFLYGVFYTAFIAASGRRVEDKAENKSIWTEMISIRMDCPPASKDVPMHLTAWLPLALIITVL